MSRYALLVGMGLLFASATGKLLIRTIRATKMSSADGYNSPLAKSYMGGFGSPMTRKEAALVLGVKQTASEQEVMTAYKKLMLINHPDNGGSTYVSSKLNEARDILLFK